MLFWRVGTCWSKPLWHGCINIILQRKTYMCSWHQALLLRQCGGRTSRPWKSQKEGHEDNSRYSFWLLPVSLQNLSAASAGCHSDPTRTEAKIYRDRLRGLNVHVMVGRLGCSQQTIFIRRYFPSGTHVLFIADKVQDMRWTYTEGKTMNRPAGSLKAD